MLSQITRIIQPIESNGKSTQAFLKCFRTTQIEPGVFLDSGPKRQKLLRSVEDAQVVLQDQILTNAIDKNGYICTSGIGAKVHEIHEGSGRFLASDAVSKRYF